MSIVIKVENLSKLYQIGIISTRNLSKDLNRKWMKLRGKEDPYLKIGRVNELNNTNGDFIWALKDINFEIEKGEVVGVIGKNGAGKSTLLKILSRVTSPTSGLIRIKGRIASLLEVGTGFHMDLTGRENIFLNGSIMGMTKQEIKRKFDEIVEFSGIEKYIDTPVKRYSSGMYVRLAFAVAAHLEPEILIVDEVLAVGDIEFQKKCLGKMKDVSKNEGKTVLIVSHTMGIISQLCKKSILLNAGSIVKIGETDDIIETYINEISVKSSINREKKYNDVNQKITITDVMTVDDESRSTDTFTHNDKIYFKISLKVNEVLLGSVISLIVKDKFDRKIFITDFYFEDKIKPDRNYEIMVEIPDNFLKSGEYSADVSVHLPNIFYY